MKKITSILLCIVMLATTVMLSSCSSLFAKDEYDFPEGYTGGFLREPNLMREGIYYWVETYDELVAAMELLKSHGSTFRKSVIFTYEGDLFDTKYYIYFHRKKSDKIKYGEDPFDRWAEDVVVASFAFYDDVSIDELVYSFVERYRCYTINSAAEFDEWYKDNPNIKASDLKIVHYSKPNALFIDRQNTFIYNQDSVKILSLVSWGLGESNIHIPDIGVNAIVESIKVIE